MHIVVLSVFFLFGELNNGAKWINFITPDTQHILTDTQHIFDERRSQIIRNCGFDWHLSPDWLVLV